MRTFCFIQVFLILVFISSCRYSDTRLRIKNISDEEIAVEFSEDTIPTGKNKVEFFIRDRIMPGDVKQFYKQGQRDEWSRLISISKNNKLNIFVYKVDTIEKYMDMDVIRRKRLYDRRISFSESELDEMRWVISL